VPVFSHSTLLPSRRRKKQRGVTKRRKLQCQNIKTKAALEQRIPPGGGKIQDRDKLPQFRHTDRIPEDLTTVTLQLGISNG